MHDQGRGGPSLSTPVPKDKFRPQPSMLVSSPLLWAQGDLGPHVAGLSKPPEMLEVRISQVKATAAPKTTWGSPEAPAPPGFQAVPGVVLGGSVRVSSTDSC